MAVPKLARVVCTRASGATATILDLAMVDGTPFGFRGGQYAIMNTGVMLPGDKPVKRAYSFFSDDRDQSIVQIAVKRLAGGPGSNALNDAAVGMDISFSGPWGKMYPDDTTIGRTLILATDTGITAAIGIARSAAFSRLAASAELIWYRTADESFLPETFVRELVAKTGARMRVEEALPIVHPERLMHMQSIVMRSVDRGGLPNNAYLSGDGTLVYGVREQLARLGADEANLKLEAFFNNPARKAA